jgi:5-methyltetrahydrofolate--homocysteine methyltransferase
MGREMSAFLDALHSGRVLLMDGAMGTELQRAGIAPNECYELWNLTHAEQVRAIHQAYVEAGAEVLLTNTFQAIPAALVRFDLYSELVSILDAAMNLARSAAGNERFVFLDLGPLDAQIRRPGAACAVQIAVRRSVDALMVETVSDIADVARIVKYRARCGLKRNTLPVLLSWTYRQSRSGEPRTIRGWPPERCAEASHRLDIVALGVNCGRDIDMDDIIEIIRRYRAVTDLPLFARPNAGTPTKRGERWIYPHTPEAMAARLPELLEAGVSMVGGCCGTTPEHIAAFRPVIEAWNK